MTDTIVLQKWLHNQLISYEPKIIETVYPEYWGFEGKHHNAVGDLPLGVEKIVSSRMDYVGSAVNYGGKATTIPLANFGIGSHSAKTAIGILAADWSIFELAKEKVASENPRLLQTSGLIQNYRNAIERGLREWMHLKAVFGDTALNMSGLLSNRDVPIIAEVQSLNTLAPAALYDWFLTRLSAFKEQNMLTTNEQISVLVSSRLALAMSRRFTDTGDGSPMGLLRALTGKITELNELAAPLLERFGVTVAGSNTDMIIFYNNQPDVLDRRYFPIEITKPNLLDDQVSFRCVGYCATSEVRIKQPLRFQYITYPR